jgi:hypothetical protein
MIKKIAVFLLLYPILVLAVNIDIPQAKYAEGEFGADLPTLLTPGEPGLPYLPVKILLPMGEKVTEINVIIDSDKFILNNVELSPNKQIQPISHAITLPEVDAKEMYENDKFFPYNDYEGLGTQRINGYEILLINLFPYKYNAVRKQLEYCTSMEIEIDTEFNESLYQEQNSMLIKDDNLVQRIGTNLINIENIHSYQKQIKSSFRNLPDPSDPYQMIIITDEQREDYFEEFVEWKNSQDILTKVFLTSEIYENYAGVDEQQKIKNFIIDAYQAYSSTNSPLEYVLLGGDDEIIPIRSVFIDANGTVDQAMPSDLYYACLDNDWDGNSNEIYAEVDDEPDLLPEISVGRFPAESAAEFANIFRKTEFYVDEGTISNDIFYAMGENLNWDPVTWGGDYMDEVLDIVPQIDEEYHLFTLYQREENYNSSLVQEAINNGLGAMNHMGHANQSFVFGITSGSSHNLNNTEYGFAYTQGCYPAAFDEFTSHESESVAENLVIVDGGLFAFIGNTRYGWYSPGNTDGPSQYYDIEYFKAVYTDNIRELGKALDQSRIEMISGALSNPYLRWVHLEMVLFGDPSVAVKNAVGGFPYIEPLEYSISDNLGDNDGLANPGETVEISISLQNQEGWSDAENVIANISFENQGISVNEFDLSFGDIPEGGNSEVGIFTVELSQDVGYGNFPFEITITAPVGTDNTFEKTFFLDFDVSLYQVNWPWYSDVAVRSNPIVIDTGVDEAKEILVVDSNGSVNLLDSDATLINEFNLVDDEIMQKSVAYADINNDQIADLIFSTREGLIIATELDGTEIFSYETNIMQLQTPVIADIDGDGDFEILSLGIDSNLIALDSNGNMKENFPINVGEISVADFACADLNEDNASEIIIASNQGKLFVYNSDAEIVNGFPFIATASICSAPVVLNNNKIAFGTNDGKIYLVNSFGEEEFALSIESEVKKEIILSDIDNDASLDLIFSTSNGKIYIVNQSGSILENWPVDIDKAVANPPLIADIDNDNNLEILLITASNVLYAFESDASIMPFTPVPMNMLGNSPASLEDIDGDGDFEILSTTANGVYALDCKFPKGSKIPWNTYRGNYRRTGAYADNTLSTSVDENIITPEMFSNLKGNYPNPFNPTTSIVFSIKEDNDYTEIEVYNVKGQKVKQLAAQSFSAGEHSIVWNGKDSNDKPVASGVYMYKMSVNGKTINIKKMLMVK